jgi:uncharacterized protein with GYD domain
LHKEINMATYITLESWATQGIQAYGNTVDRAEASAQLATKLGATLMQTFWTLGQYDVVQIVEAPDDETATAFALALSSLGNVRTTTLRAFDGAEMRGIVAKEVVLMPQRSDLIC